MCFPIIFALMVVLHMSPNSVQASPHPVDEEIFDASLLEEYEMPAACEGKSFCFEKGDSYPDERIVELLADMRELKVDNPETQTSIGDRKKRESKEERPSYDEPDCPSNTTEKPIYYIVDDNDKVRVVVQSPEKFLQIYTVTWCLNEGPIRWDTPHFLKERAMRYAIECVTTKMDFDFFVLSDELDPDTNKPKMEIARPKGGIPVCCKCRYSLSKE